MICFQALDHLQQFPSIFGHLFCRLLELQYRLLSILDSVTLVHEQSLLALELSIEELIHFPHP
jgi:hypothetical protein